MLRSGPTVFEIAVSLVCFFFSKLSIYPFIYPYIHPQCAPSLLIVSMREQILAHHCVCAQLSNIQHRWDTGKGGRLGGGNRHTNKRTEPAHPSTHASIYSSDRQSTHLAVFKYLLVLKETVQHNRRKGRKKGVIGEECQSDGCSKGWEEALRAGAAVQHPPEAQKECQN